MAKKTKTAPSKRQGGGGGVLGFLFGLILLVGLAAGGAYFWARSQYEQAGPATPDGAPRVVMIEKGASTPQIAHSLKEAGAIDDETSFRLALRFARYLGLPDGVTGAPVLKAGEYEIASGASIKSIIGELAEGKSLQYAVIVPEGLTTTMIMDLLGKTEWMTTQDRKAIQAARAAGKTPPAPLRTYRLAGAMEVIPAEGVLLPGDYAVTRGDTLESVVHRMIKAQQDLLADLWPTRQPGLPIKTQEDAIKLASIVENETGLAEERPLVASLFMNRLRKPMRLQSDPTIVYGLTQGVPLGHGLRASEIARETEWNTYQIDGLPKTPICNPGREAIKAVLNPPQTNYLYFVADGSGGHAFAETLAEHLANVAKWRKLESAGETKPKGSN